MILLQSNDKYDEIAELEPDTGVLKTYSRRQEAARAVQPVRGHFAHLDGHVMILYRDMEVLHFRVDDADVALTDASRVELQQENGWHRLIVNEATGPLLQLLYKRPNPDPPLESDPTSFVEEEDFDFGVFVHNVVNDSARHTRIYR